MATTDAGHVNPIAPDSVQRRFGVGRPERVWVADTTHISTGQGFLYLAGAMDLASRRIVGWSIGPNLRASLACRALEMAIEHHRPSSGLVHHSDRGVLYACGEYQRLLARHGMVASMSRRGNCYDSAVTESFWGKLKTELVHQCRFQTHDQARAAIFEYIEVFYNRRRLHSTLGYISPEQFEASRS